MRRQKIPLDSRPEFVGPTQAQLTFVRGKRFTKQARVDQIPGTIERVDRCAAEIIPLPLLHLGDGRGRVTGHDRKVVPQRGVTVGLFEPEFDQFNQVCPLDGE